MERFFKLFQHTSLAEDLLFIAVVGTVGIVAGWCLRTLYAASRVGWKQYKFSLFDRGVLALGLLGVSCVIYGWLIEPFQLTTTIVSLQSKKLPPTAGTVRIVQITDLHCDGIERTEPRLVEETRRLSPDAIVFTGDAANNTEGFKRFRDCIAQLSTIAPLYVVYGNHDIWRNGGGGAKIYKGLNVHLLQGEGKALSIKGANLWISGNGVYNDAVTDQLLQRAPKDAFTIFLNHFPSGVKAASAHGIDLFCAGHTHGGQICLPLYGAVITQSSMGRPFAYGMHKFHDTTMFVSRGIGMTGLPMRFLAPPEVAVIDISPAR